jgi:heterodisulfide reductase subunit B
MPDKPAINTLSYFALPADLVESARRAVEDALGVELVPLLDREEITVTAAITEEAAEAVLRLAARYLSASAPDSPC